ncbi:MAG: carbon-nitrogen hydrolase [Clostridia bacterium]|nr:carbon-nitrogen hydrolase [Clostridia bacterium]
MRKVTVGCIQMRCTNDRADNVERAVTLVKEACAKGAKVILLPELFERPYFCQERCYDYYAFAEEPKDNKAIRAMIPLSREMSCVIIVSFFERDGKMLYNSAAVLDCGKILGVYRKTHIPDDHYYQEKFYFSPGNTGFRTFKTSAGCIGVGICWDQWFPETARCLALKGAELIFFPTAIGSEPILGTDSSGHWMRVMQGHAAANMVPVIAANRYGTEFVEPTEANGHQSSALTFYGSSFISGPDGEILRQAPREGNAVLIQSFDLDELDEMRLNWGLFRDRRPEMYKEIIKK